MNVQTLIDILSDFDPDSEVKLAIQPEWAFQHSIREVVEVQAVPKSFEWGVTVETTDGDIDFNTAEPNTLEDARELCFELQNMKDDGDDTIVSIEVGASYVGALMDVDEAEELLMNQATYVYIAESGQDCYLPEAAKEALGWSRR